MITIKATLPLGPNNTSVMGYLLSITPPCASTPRNWHTHFAIPISAVAIYMKVPPAFLDVVSYSPNLIT